ncbi:MAG: hypothetical protein H6713_13425 [Myxococcales bacterium]|nr:hypothetical protein [Myxococcales bacterium]
MARPLEPGPRRRRRGPARGPRGTRCCRSSPPRCCSRPATTTSLTRLREAGERSPAVGARARQHALAYASRLGWNRELAEALRELARLVPGRVMWHEQAAALHRLGHSDDAALRHVDAAARLEPDAPRWPLARAELLAGLGEPEAAQAALAEAVRRAGADGLPALREQLVAASLEAGDFARAARAAGPSRAR